MVYLARGRDVDTPAVIVLLDGDPEADRIADELRRGYRGKRHLDDAFILRTSGIEPISVSISTDAVREIEDLIPAELAVLAINRYADEVLISDDAEKVKSVVTKVEVAPGDKLFKAAAAACQAVPGGLRLDKVGFARAVLSVLEDGASEDLRSTTLRNFDQLFMQIAKAQRDAVRRNSRERTHRTVSRFVRAFRSDHPDSAARRDVTALVEDIEGQLVEVTDETEQMRGELRLIRKDFALEDEPASRVENLEGLVERLQQLTYQGVRRAQE